ncbi:DDE Tnp 1 7 domain containing protein, partial [Asbolus verrucosus]
MWIKQRDLESFDDIQTRSIRKENDKLCLLREASDLFVKSCREPYNASEMALTIDEQLASFRGRGPLRVYMANKSVKYGIKIWVRSHSKFSYYCNFEVYLGKVGDVPETNQGPRIVKTLVEF